MAHSEEKEPFKEAGYAYVKRAAGYTPEAWRVGRARTRMKTLSCYASHHFTPKSGDGCKSVGVSGAGCYDIMGRAHADIGQ
jgi:hypothetical protein